MKIERSGGRGSVWKLRGFLSELRWMTTISEVQSSWYSGQCVTCCNNPQNCHTFFQDILSLSQNEQTPHQTNYSSEYNFEHSNSLGTLTRIEAEGAKSMEASPHVPASKVTFMNTNGFPFTSLTFTAKSKVIRRSPFATSAATLYRSKFSSLA